MREIKMVDPERMSLLQPKTRRPSTRPYCNKVLAALCVGAAVVTLVVSLRFAYLRVTTNKPVHISSNSFQAKLKLSKHLQKDTEDIVISIDINWNCDTRSIEYQETQTTVSDSTSHANKTITRFVYANNSAMLGVMYDKEEKWFCQNSTESVEWFTVVQIILQKPATSYTGSHVNDQSCTGNTLSTTAAGQTIVFCIQDSRLVYIDHAGTRALVTEWNERLPDVIKLPPKLDKCNTVYPTNISLLEDDLAVSQNYSSKPGQSLLKRNPKKHCLFVHGAGEHPPTDRYIDVPALPSYWGHIEQYTPQCLTRRFMWYNSINRGWDDTASHKMFCEFAVGNSSGPISNSMLFTHSMGNLVVAAAFHRRFCQLDHNTSKWYSLQAPWRGSKVSNELHSLCSKTDLETKITYIVLRELHYCEVNSSRPAQAYVSMETTYVSPTGVSYEDLIRTARRYISGAVCGNSAFGIGLSLSMSARLHLVSTYTHLPLPNDGLVAFESCNIKGKFENKPTAKYYSGYFNHAEGTCRYGERHCFTTSRQHPCQWYSK